MKAYVLARLKEPSTWRGVVMMLTALGVPIAYALLLSGFALMWHLDMFDAQILAQNVINGADSFPLLAVPFFMLAAEIMNVGGLSRRIIAMAQALVVIFAKDVLAVGPEGFGILNAAQGVGTFLMSLVLLVLPLLSFVPLLVVRQLR